MTAQNNRAEVSDAEGWWNYSINYGPDGEENYANVYTPTGEFVGNLKIHHARQVVGGLNDAALSTSHPEPASAVQVTEETARALKAIAEGYKVKGFLDRYIQVQNPDYADGNGRDPYLVIDVEAILSQSQPAPQPDAKASVDHHAYRVAHIPEPTGAGVEELRRPCAASDFHDHDGCSCSDGELLRRATAEAPEVKRWALSIVSTNPDVLEMQRDDQGDWVRLSDHNTIVERLHMVLTARRRRLDRWIADGVDAINRADQAESALTIERERSARLREAAQLALKRLTELDRDDEYGVRNVLGGALAALRELKGGGVVRLTKAQRAMLMEVERHSYSDGTGRGYVMLDGTMARVASNLHAKGLVVLPPGHGHYFGGLLGVRITDAGRAALQQEPEP